MRSRGWVAAALALAAVLTALTAACAPAERAQHRAPKVVTLTGRLLRVRGTTLSVQGSGGAGVEPVTFAPTATPIYAVTAATTATIQPGSCVVAREQRDAEGSLIADVIVVATSVNDACPADLVPTPASPLPADPAPSPSPQSSPVSTSPSPALGPALVRGQVLSLGGGSLGVEVPHGQPAVLHLGRDLQVLFFEPSGPSALVKQSCVVIQGTGAGHTIAARRIVDWPPRAQC